MLRDTPPARSGKLDALLTGALLLLSGFLLSNILFYGHGRDQSIYALIGDGLFAGKVPYRDLWDIKPPGIFLLYGIPRLVLGPSMIAIRIVEAAGLASLVWAFVLLSRWFVRDGRAGVVGACLGLLAYVQLEFWHTAQPEGFGGICLAWALVCASWLPGKTEEGRRKQRRLWLLAGVLYGIAGLLKPPLAGGALASIAVAHWRGRASPGGEPGGSASGADAASSVPSAHLLAGAALPVILTLGYFAIAGGLPQLQETLLHFAPMYTGLDYDPSWTIELLYRAVEQWLFWFSPFALPGLAMLLLLSPLGPREKEGVVHVMGVVLAQLLGVALQGKFIPYHYAGAIPLAGLLAGWGFWKLWLAARKRVATAAAYAALIAVLAAIVTPTQMEEGPAYHFWPRCAQRLRSLWRPEIRQATGDRLHSHYDMNMGANRQVAGSITSRTGEEDALFVWGFEPLLYELSGRRPASRYIQNQPLRAAWSRVESRRLLMDDLRRSPPRMIVVQHNDVFPPVTGDNQDSAAALLDFPELMDLIRQDYAPAGIIEDFELYARTAQ